MRKLFTAIFFCVLFSIPAMAQQQTIRVRCGGGSYTDSSKNVWQADTDYTGGTTVDANVQVGGTSDQSLYQTGRQNRSGSNTLTYTFPVANGTYQVNLLFAETSVLQEAIGARVFDVQMNGNMAYQNLDIFAAAGARAAMVKSMQVLVQKGSLSIEFTNVTGEAKIDAIEIAPIPVNSPALNLNFVYPDGTPVVGTLSYMISSSLLSFNGSTALSNGKAECNLVTSPTALGISTQFQVTLSLTDNSGNTLWQINLVLNPAAVNLGTVQSSTLNVVVNKA